MEASLDRYQTSGVGFPFRKDEDFRSQGQLLEKVYFAKVMRRTHSSLMKHLKRDPKVVADQLGHTLDVNQNVYTQVPMELKIEAVNKLEAVLVSQ